MDRRDFLKTTGAVAAGVAAGATAAATAEPASQPTAPAIHSGVTHLVLATSWTPDAPGFSAGRLAQRIEMVSGGRFRIEISSGAVGRNGADLIFAGAHEHTRHHPAFAFFAGLPRDLGLDAVDLPAWLTVGGGQMLWDELGADFGIKPLLAGHTGASAGLWSNRPLGAAADFASLKLFATGLAGDVARAIGADPVEVAPLELRAALAGSRIDAAEWLGPLAVVAPDLQPLAARIYEPGLTPAGMALALTVRRDLWERMDVAEQAMLEVCATAEHHVTLAEARAHAVIASRLALSAQRLPLNSGLAAALDHAAGDVVERLAATDPMSRRIADSHRAFRGLLGTGLPAATT